MVLIGLGSNLGDSAQVIRTAAAELRRFARSGYACSALWLTAPVDCPPGSADFVNAVVRLLPPRECTPERLLRQLKRMELVAGRQPNARRNAPRPLDLDLLVYGQQQRLTPLLHLPHPRASQRRFVLAPAAEVAPDLRWPGTGKTVRQLLDQLDSTEHARPLD